MVLDDITPKNREIFENLMNVKSKLLNYVYIY